MSHFSLVVTTAERPTDDVLHAALLPFHEHETTGYLEYTQFVATDMDEANKEYAEVGNGCDFDEFMREWYGAELNDDGVYGRITNPNNKWDWWTIGGRWSNRIVTRMGERVNSCQKRNLAHDLMAEDRRTMRVSMWARYMRDLERGLDEGPARWINGIPDTTDEQSFIDTDPGFTTFAILHNGEWIEKGKMRWFAMVADEKADWNTIYPQIFNAIPDDYYITIIDCHI